MTDVVQQQEYLIQEVMQRLPHRYPFLMVDKVISYVPGESLRAIKNVTVNEPFFTGHFPNQPVMPGVMILEALAQAGGLLAYLTTNSTPDDYMFYLVGLENVRFKQMVLPGDQLELCIEMHKTKGDFWKIIGQAKVQGNLVCCADIMSARRKTA